MRLIAFDVGGSHIAAALCETEPLRRLGRLSLAVDSAASGAAFYRVIDVLVAMILENSGVVASDLDGMAFAFPGPFDYSRGVSLLKHKFASLHGTDLRRELRAARSRAGR